MDYYQVGAITQTHGVRGEVKVFPMTDEYEGSDFGYRKRKDHASGDIGQTPEESCDSQIQRLR